MIQFDDRIFFRWVELKPPTTIESFKSGPGPLVFASSNPVQATALMVMAACHHAKSRRSSRLTSSRLRWPIAPTEAMEVLIL